MEQSCVTQWPEKYNVCGVEISSTNYQELSELIISAAMENDTAIITALAVHGLITAGSNSLLAKNFNQFQAVCPDGQPVRWALKWLHNITLRDRVYGPQLMLSVCERAERTSIPIYLYGSYSSVVNRLKVNLAGRFPHIKIVATEPSLFRPLTADEDSQLVERINRSGAKIVFLGLGCPLQEEFAFGHKDTIKAVQICVGAAFDFHSGNKKMAPGWMQAMGLEWLYRLLQEPSRLWRRYFVTNTIFLSKVLLQLAGLRKYTRLSG